MGSGTRPAVGETGVAPAAPVLEPQPDAKKNTEEPKEAVTVRVVAVPSDALLSVEGGTPSRGPLALSAPAGQPGKDVEVSAEGFESQRVTITFDHSRTQLVELAPIPSVRAAPANRGVTRRRAQRTREKASRRQQPGDPFSLPLQRPPRRSIDVSDPFEE
jgi:hypothetical protein